MEGVGRSLYTPKDARYLVRRSFRSKVVKTHTPETSAQPGPVKWSVITVAICKKSEDYNSQLGGKGQRSTVKSVRSPDVRRRRCSRLGRSWRLFSETRRKSPLARTPFSTPRDRRRRPPTVAAVLPTSRATQRL